MSIGLSYELLDDILTVYTEFGFDYYYDPETGEQFFDLTYYIDWNNGQYVAGGRGDHPGWTDMFTFPADVDGHFRLEVGANESWTWASAQVIKNIIIATHNTAPQTVTGTSGEDVLFASNLVDNASLGDGNDFARMGEGDDVVDGGAGADTLDGQGGADSMSGGTGDDWYYVDNTGDQVVELADEGMDTIISAVSLTLSANVERLLLAGEDTDLNGTGNGLANHINGNVGDNVLRGLGGSDILNGSLGADRLYGGRGNDTYIIDADDRVVERAGEGNDTVVVSFNCTLTGRPEIENVILAGTNNINANGNGGSNRLIGNEGNNVLDGKAGADYMKGGNGSDTYVVDDVGDRVDETGTFPGSIDLVKSSVSFTLGTNVDDLHLTGTADIDGTGNTLDNHIKGNAGANVLKGGLGDDVLIGGAGEDTLLGGGGNDRLTGGEDDDTLTGGSGNDVFAFKDGDGNDTVTDFQNNFNLIDLRHITGVHAFEDLVLTDTGPGVQVDYGTGSVLLANVANFAAINAADFLFA